MAIKVFKAKWMGQYRQSTNNYYGSVTPVRVGGSEGYNSFLGFDYNEILTALQSSKTTPSVHLVFRVITRGSFDLGMHKEAYDRKTFGIPFYVWTGRSLTPSTGWADYDITTFSRTLPNTNANTFQEALEAGYRGPILYGGISTPYGSAYGVTGDSNHFRIEVHGTWNTRPTDPSVKYPKGGEIFDEVHTVDANPATDAEQSQSQLRYKWAVHDGTGWTYFDYGPKGQTSKVIDFSDFAETSSAQVAVRASDGELETSYQRSKVFTIRHNKPPKIPTNLSPKGGVYLDRTEDIQFSWQHNDDEPQSIFHIQWRVKGETTWNGIYRSSPNEYYIAPAEKFPAGEIEWRMATIDQGDLRSEWTSIQLFHSTESTNAPTILRPEANGTVIDPNPVVEWSSSEQDEYKAEIVYGGNVIWSDSKNSSVKAFTLPYELNNMQTYTVRVAVKSDEGLWSAWASHDFTTSFTEPSMARLSVSAFPDDARIEIGIENPEPAEESEPIVSSNEVYRSVLGKDEFIKVSAFVAPNGVFIDYSPASGVIYEYRVRAWGENGAFVDSESIEASVTFKQSIISRTSDLQDKLWLQWNPARQQNKNLNRTLFKFNGRSNYVAEYDNTIDKELDISFDIRDGESVERIYDILDSKETLLYRDGRGRREFVTLGEYSLDEKPSGGYSLSFTMDAMDYKEEII